MQARIQKFFKGGLGRKILKEKCLLIHVSTRSNPRNTPPSSLPMQWAVGVDLGLRAVQYTCSLLSNRTVIKSNFNRIFSGPLRKTAEIFSVHTNYSFPTVPRKIIVLALQIKQYLLGTELTKEQVHQALINLFITNKIMWYVCNNTNDHLDNNTAIKVFENE